MKFVVKINDRKLLLTGEQIDQLAEVIHGCDFYEERYVGQDKGTVGSSNSYRPEVKPCLVDEWFDAKVMREDLIETIKLQMKLEKET